MDQKILIAKENVFLETHNEKYYFKVPYPIPMYFILYTEIIIIWTENGTKLSNAKHMSKLERRGETLFSHIYEYLRQELIH